MVHSLTHQNFPTITQHHKTHLSVYNQLTSLEPFRCPLSWHEELQNKGEKDKQQFQIQIKNLVYIVVLINYMV